MSSFAFQDHFKTVYLDDVVDIIDALDDKGPAVVQRDPAGNVALDGVDGDVCLSVVTLSDVQGVILEDVAHVGTLIMLLPAPASS